MVENQSLKEYSDITKITGKNIEIQECVTQDSTDNGENALLFFSFDIVNSSLYKTVNYYGWSIFIDNILTEIRKQVKAKRSEAEVWRILGDEIIFIEKIKSKESLFNCVEYIYEILTVYQNKIEDGSLFKKDPEISEISIELGKLQDIISLQGTAWIANVMDKKKIKDNKLKNKYVENIFEEIEENPRYKFYEFMGIDIDTGFRLSKETKAGRLTLSFELAYLMALEKTEKYKNCLYIVSYRNLKGVWNNSCYPIIWYYDTKKHNDISFKDSLPFDAIEQDDLYVEYFGKRKFAEYMYFDVKRALDKICTDRKLKTKIDNIEQVIEKVASENKRYIDTARLEMHCVAVCFNTSGEIFCVERADNVYMPSKWEFGCAKANHSEDLEKTIKDEYKKDFNVEVELYMDESRDDKQPVPIAMYSVNKKPEFHKGVIFIGKIQFNEIICSDKHKSYKFISKEDLVGMKADEFVPDALDTMEKAFKLYEEVYGVKRENRIL